jgi:SAM-dependent methyltransferase
VSPARDTAPPSNDERAFHEFEQRGWRAAAAAYQSVFARLTVQAAPALLDAAGVKKGTRLLDLASGPGDLAAQAHARGARVIGGDFATTMLAIARERHPEVEFREADAEALTFDDASFDAVTMSFLVGHLARPETAFAEAHRVLAARGRIAFSWWQPPGRAVAFELMFDAVRAHGSMDVGIPAGPPFDRFSEPQACVELLRGAGFAEPRVEPCDMTWIVASGDELFDVYLNGSVRSSALLRGQTPEALREIRTAVVASIEALGAQDGKISVPMPCWVASAARP